MKIDEGYIASKNSPYSNLPLDKPHPRSWLRKYLDPIISDAPKAHGIKESSLRPGTQHAYDFIDEERIIWDRSSNKESYYKWGWISLGFNIFFILYLLAVRKDESLLWVIAIGFIFFIPVTFCFIYWKYAPDKKVLIFNRMEGTVELPGMLWDKPHLVKFNDLHAVIGMSKYNMFLMAMRTRSWWDRMGSGVSIGIGAWAPWESWSYWVWYMDRNRPLPPGTAFDLYRQKDYKRRMKEGFPPPLYESRIPTPEHYTDANNRSSISPNMYN